LRMWRVKCGCGCGHNIISWKNTYISLKSSHHISSNRSRALNTSRALNISRGSWFGNFCAADIARQQRQPEQQSLDINCITNNYGRNYVHKVLARVRQLCGDYWLNYDCAHL